MTPLVLLVGFLGSGKTTLLKNLAPRLTGRGLRPGIIINDYQNALVDAGQLRALGIEAGAISGDCVCCGSREELVETLVGFEHGDGRVALVEANGTTDSEQLIEMLSLEPRLGGFCPPMQVSVVDALRWQKRFWHNALEREQARTGNRVFVSRAGDVKPGRLADVQASLEKLGLPGSLSTVETLTDEITGLAAEMGPLPPRSIGDPRPHHHSHDHDHHHFASLELPLTDPVDRSLFENALARLPAGVLRAKGLVRFADAPSEFLVFQKVDHFDAPQFFPVGPSPQIRKPLALFIGPTLDQAEIEATFGPLIS